MTNLSLIEQQVLAILFQLEYYCDTTTSLPDPKNKNTFVVTFGDIDFSSLRKITDLYSVATYLTDKGLDFSITHDLVNDIPITGAYLDSDHPSEDSVQLGTIKGKSIKAIEEKIKQFISELNIKKSESIKKEISITYNINMGQFIFNGKNTVEVEGKQKDASDCLVKAGENKKVSWEEMHERMDDISGIIYGELLNLVQQTKVKRGVNGVVSEINFKTKEYLEPEKPLINFKENEYWLQYKVSTKSDKVG